MKAKENSVIIYADGASRGNPGPGGWGTVVLTPEGRVTELGGKSEHTTNNKMELTAAIEGLEHVREDSDVTFYTDSAYVVNGITKWVKGWQKNNWQTSQKKDVENRDLWERLVESAKGKHITWHQVKGHAGLVGNERADAIAALFADSNTPVLYGGDYTNYGHDLHDLSYDERKEKKKKNDRRAAYAYVSLVDGVFSVDKTWSACEKKVKGKRGAKFKKIFSAAEEVLVRREWKVS